MTHWKTRLVAWSRSRTAAARSKKYLYQLIWLTCIAACIPVVLASVVYHYVATERIGEYILSRSESSLLQLKDRSERILQEIEQESLQLAQAPLMQRMIADPANDDSFEWHRDLLEQLAFVKNMNGFIGEISLYVSSDEIVLSHEYGVVSKEHYKYNSDLEGLLAGEHPTQWVYLPKALNDGYITFSRLLPVIGTGGPKAVLAFEIDAASISRFLETDTVLIPDDGDLIIFNYQDLFASHNLDAAELLRRAPELEGIAAIASSEESSGRFVADGPDGRPAQYSYAKNLYSRTYVAVVPEEAITRQLDQIRGLTAIILLSFVGIGVVLTVITSRRAYSPIRQLIERSRALSVGRVPDKENELDFIKACLDSLSAEKNKLALFMEGIEPSLRENCLQQLLAGEYARQEALLQDCAKYGIHTRGTHVVLAVEAEHIYRENRFLPEERGIVAFALANVMQEILRGQPSAGGYVVPFQGRGIAILQFDPDTGEAEMRQSTQEYAQAVVAALRDSLSFEVVAGIGRGYAHIADVPVSYKEAENALRYRMFRDSEQILYIEDAEAEKTQAVLRYPGQLETDIVDALERGDTERAAESLRAFANALRPYQSYAFIHQSCCILLSSIIVSLDKQNVNLVEVVDNRLFDQLEHKMTFAEICEWFEETVFPLYAWLAQSMRESETKLGIPYVCKYIRDHCGEDLSLVQCAELIGVSPSYLSRLFKKETGMNFLEYVVECKVAEAKRLLRDTELSVSEIASAVGYSERNLNRIFQRHASSSPGSYRGKHR
ncbi:helix-turn-helix domain-containing protein [Cohnella cellulosilytica]|uniref:Helix-turn-helix domain-containing protein n=1 Tax=Cohnella cellulosilytica TaxID=986710 RepID=A0ABW2FD99_9BACL